MRSVDGRESPFRPRLPGVPFLLPDRRLPLQGRPAGVLRSGRCRGSAPILVSAMFSQLLRGGVNARAVRGAIDRFARA